MRRVLAALTGAATVLSFAVSPAPAGDGAMASGNERTQALIEELRTLLDRAEENREADPWLIEDMRDLLVKYEFPWTRTVYASDFTQRGKGAPRPWRVRSGSFRVDDRGLRSAVERAEPGTQKRDRGKREQERESGSGDKVRDLLGSMMDEALGKGGSGKDERSRDTDERQAEPESARAFLSKGVGNAFAMQIRFSGTPPASGTGHFAFGPYQGGDGEAGYRVTYSVEGQSASLALIKHAPRGTQSTVARHDKVPRPRRGESHTLMWTRNRDGRMQIDVDGQQVVDVTDRGFSDPFDGVLLENGGGTFTVDAVILKDDG